MDNETILSQLHDAIYKIEADSDKEIEALYLKHGFSREFIEKHSEDFRVETTKAANVSSGMNLWMFYHYYRDKVLFICTKGYVIDGLSVKYIFKKIDFRRWEVDLDERCTFINE